MNTQGKTSKRPFIVLMILFLLFLTPIFLAWYAYKTHDMFGEKTTNHGHLIMPPLSISKINLFNNKGQLLDNAFTTNKAMHPSATSTNGKWMLVLMNPGECNKRCMKGLTEIRQLWRASGKNSDRLERAVITFNTNSDTNAALEQAVQSKKYAGTRLLFANQQQFTKTVKNYLQQPYIAQQGTIYLVDPNGNIMMSYKPSANPNNIYKDLNRLLKVSQIG